MYIDGLTILGSGHFSNREGPKTPHLGVTLQGAWTLLPPPDFFHLVPQGTLGSVLWYARIKFVGTMCLGYDSAILFWAKSSY